MCRMLAEGIGERLKFSEPGFDLFKAWLCEFGMIHRVALIE